MIASRADPPIALARLRARGALGELRAADLAFTAAEARALVERMPDQAELQGLLELLSGLGVEIVSVGRTGS